MSNQTKNSRNMQQIYCKILEGLKRQGFVPATGVTLTPNSTMVLVAKHALTPIEGINEENYKKRRLKLSKKMQLAPLWLEFLLAVVKEDRHMVYWDQFLEKIQARCGMPAITLKTIREKLISMHYIELFGDEYSDDDKAFMIVTKEALMCLLAEEPIFQLHRNLFTRVENQPQNRHETAYEEQEEDQPLVVSAVGAEYHDDHDLFGVPGEPLYPDPFIPCLKEESAKYLRNRNAEMFINEVDKCFVDPENERFRIALDQIGFNALEKEQQATLLLLCSHFIENGVTPLELPNDKMNTAAKSLVTAGLAVIPPRVSSDGTLDEKQELNFMISDDVAGKMFHGMNELIDYSSICKQAEVWPCSKIDVKELFFDDHMKEEINVLKDSLVPENYQNIMEELGSIGQKSLICLFYGAPGTGKTELCRQLARMSGRDCIVADPSKLTGSLFGESERNMRELFRSYRYLQKISENAPILVFNEADALLSKRVNVERASDQCVNAVQAILLQELETFEGIFVATTNLQRNLDGANERRFLYKIRFDVPSPKIRAEIFLQKLKCLSPEDARSLADEFQLSGAQIDNVNRKITVNKTLYHEEATLDKIREYCLAEVSMRDDQSRKNKIGFIFYN